MTDEMSLIIDEMNGVKKLIKISEDFDELEVERSMAYSVAQDIYDECQDVTSINTDEATVSIMASFLLLLAARNSTKKRKECIDYAIERMIHAYAQHLDIEIHVPFLKK
jgi:hypothetical protein